MLLFLSVIFAILSLLFYGVVDFVAYLLARQSNPVKIPLWTTSLSAAVLAIGLYFFKLPFISNNNMFLIFFASAIGVVAILSFYKGLSLGKIAVVVPIAQTWSIIPVLVGLFCSE